MCSIESQPIQYVFICLIGVCKNCLFNTTGDHCEKCKDDFEGDPTKKIPCTQKGKDLMMFYMR